MPTFSRSYDPTGIGDGFAAPQRGARTQDTDKDELLGNLMQMFRQCRSVKHQSERQWDWNLSYLRGELLYQDVVNGQITRTPTKKRLYSKNNRLRPIARSLVGKLSRSVPSFTTTPATMEQDEVYGARVADASMQYFNERQNIASKFVEMSWHLTWAGNACIQALWDECAGRRLAYCEECQTTYENQDLVGQNCIRCEAVITDGLALEADRIANEAIAVEEGALLPEQMTPPQPPPKCPTCILVYEGDVVAKVHDPRTLYADPLALKPNELRYIFVVSVEPVTKLRTRFPGMADKIVPGGAVQNVALYPNLAPGLSTAVNGAYSIYSDATTFYEYHEAPSFSHPKGRVIYFTQEYILAEKEGTYDIIGRLPFYFNWWERDAGYFWAESFITQAWSRQKELNELETALRETVEILARPKVITYANSGIPGDEITAQTGQIIKAKLPGYEPRYMDAPPLPDYLFERKASFVDDMRSQASVTAQDEAGSDANGRVMAIIEAESNQQIGPIFKQNAAEWKEFYYAVIKLQQANYSTDKKFMVAGAEGLSVYCFNDMRFDEGSDLVLEMEDGLSNNPAIRLQQVTGMANLPIFLDPKTGQFNVAAFAEMARLKIPGVSIDLNATEYAAATAMVKAIETGQGPVFPKMYDDPMIFSKVMLQWLRSSGRKDADPELIAKVEQLWMYYTQVAAGTAQAPPDVFGSPGGQSQAGQVQSAPGGTPNGPGAVGTDVMSEERGGGPTEPGPESGGGVLNEASKTIKMNDKAAEGQARIQERQES